MKKVIGILLVAAFINGCKSSNVASMNGDGSASSGQGKEEFKPLFDGKTTSGWHGYGKPDGAGWKVDNGALTPDPAAKGHVDLVTNEEYDNYHLKLEWKISPKGNSGIIFFINEDPAKYRQTYETGLEMQVLDNDGHADGKIIKHRAGDLYDLITVSKETVKPVGEWNKAEVVAKDGKLDLYLNGEHSVSTTLWDDNWKNMVANSKFKSMPGFGTFKKGKIGLQYHGDIVWYRNIEIKKL
jgi:hypothetical protein